MPIVFYSEVLRNELISKWQNFTLSVIKIAASLLVQSFRAFQKMFAIYFFGESYPPPPTRKTVIDVVYNVFKS